MRSANNKVPNEEIKCGLYKRLWPQPPTKPTPPPLGMMMNLPNESHKHDPPQNIPQLKPENRNPQHKTTRTPDEPHTCFAFHLNPWPHQTNMQEQQPTCPNDEQAPYAQPRLRTNTDRSRKQVQHTHFGGIILDSKPELPK
ncbi:hypothetical protein BS47DRAFT_1361060 [Hydnum rufescens UP504]|uniref:Uncharacterized protein n=1 Tax=Hydnum rufescens UP504 TaxID=1448309 RepID=A0A9P6B0Q6_9AGAM|nr:hypothetical protein BS47DRAFT_1361060 [Hydnum rufescens UP504]